MRNDVLKLSCPCGGSFEMPLSYYINNGGRADEFGRVFIAEVRGDEWLNRHRDCLTQLIRMRAEPKMEVIE